MGSRTPTNPRHERAQELAQKVLGLASPTWRPTISLRPVSCTPWAIATHLRTTRPSGPAFLDLGVDELAQDVGVLLADQLGDDLDGRLGR
jgi:hypothetical protein